MPPRKNPLTPEERAARRKETFRRYQQSAKGKANKRRHYDRHIEEIKAYDAAKYERNKEKINAHDRTYHAEHSDEICARKRAQYWENPEKENARNKIYLATHPHVVAQHNGRRRAAKANAPINDLTAAQWETIKAQFGYRCAYCGHKVKKLTQDHIIPLSKGGSHTMSNIVPACKSCNSKKRDRAPLIPVQPLLL